MTEDKEQILKNLNSRVHDIMTLCDRVKAENVVLKARNEELTEEKKVKDLAIQDLKAKVEILTTANSLLSGENSHDLKIKLNRILREIDDCIKLMSKYN